MSARNVLKNNKLRKNGQTTLEKGEPPCPGNEINYLEVALANGCLRSYFCGMPKTYTPEQRTKIVDTVLRGISVGTPMAALCRQQGMPDQSTIWDWCQADPALAQKVARARDDGFDALALEALAIADQTEDDTVIGEKGKPVANNEWIARSRLRVDTRLKLLACWDPKRYGNKTTIQGDKDAPLETKTTLELAKGTAAELAKTMRAVAQAKDDAKDIL